MEIEAWSTAPTRREAGLVRIDVDRALRVLTARERAVVRAWFLYGLSLREIGWLYGVTHERIRQVALRGVRKLKTSPSTRRVLLDWWME